MSFEFYLSESINSEGSKEITIEDFIAKIKSKGLYGYKIFDHISEQELKNILNDDSYFSKMKNSGDIPKLEEMVIRPNKDQEVKEEPKQNALSLAVKLGLKKEEPNNTLSQSKDKPTIQSFADRMRAENEKRAKEREEKINQEKELRDEQRAKAEEERKQREEERNSAPTFGGSNLNVQREKDIITTDKKNDELDKKLTNAMYARKRANVVSDDKGYKKVTNANFDDKKSSDNLKKEMDKSVQKEDPNKKLGNSNMPVKKMTNNEYSKRTLLAIADRMDFTVYCKYRKLNGQTRTGEFKIGKTDSQITKKPDTIIVIDLNLTKDPKEPAWRTINLDKIIEIKPL